MSSVNRFVTCPDCLAVIAKKRAVAKAEYDRIGK
jgi:hypothetical protein